MRTHALYLSCLPLAGLNKSFSSGTIFCSPITATLLIKDMGMPSHRICSIPVDKPTTIDGVEITPMDANHCPGAVMFLFKIPEKGCAAKNGKQKHQVRLGISLLNLM